MDVLKIACVGDTMCGDSFNRLGWGVASSLDKYGSNFLPPDIVNIFSSHDLVICNMESVLSNIGRKDYSLRTLHMRGRPQTAAYLAKWGITVAHVANNHILEQGLKAAGDTVRQLEKAGVRTVGAGKDSRFQSGIKPLHLQFSDQPIAIIGVCFHSGKYAFSSNLDEVLKTIKAESDKANLVILTVHWGDELIDRPNTWQKKASQEFINAGATLVIGHHAHVFQGVDDRNGRLVAYSLGNFIFDSESDITGWSVILSIKIKEHEVIDWQAIPVIRGKDFRPSLAEGNQKKWIEQEVFRRCELAKAQLDSPKEYERAYKLELDALEKTDRKALWQYLLKNSMRYRWIFWPQILWRPVQRRIGTW